MRRTTAYLLLAAALVAVAATVTGCSNSSSSTPAQSSASQQSAQSQSAATGQPTTAPSQSQPPAEASLKIVDEKVGKGTAAKTGDTVTVNYTGWLTDGTKFDSSLDRNEPFSFTLGAGQVIEGWDKGVVGMKVGGKRKLTIPPDMGYGAQGANGVIPPNATLVFEITLLKIN